MIVPDIVISWPRNCDYPMWRKFIRENRNRFKDVIIVITETNQGYDYSDFIKEEMGGYCTVVKSPPVLSGQDWRNISTNFGLTLCSSEWVWFTEQDFYPNEEFWEYISQITMDLNNVNVIGAYQGDRLHPCCIFAKRAVVDKTRRDFSITPGVADHFYKFQQDIKNISVIRISAGLYEHLNGLSSNFSLIANGGVPNYEVDRFDKYIADSLNSKETLHPNFIKVCQEYLDRK
ncbi:hypothetical protein KKB83_04210 [Patescibacteria group bacterium]|nr:hypothetical protein [Patescibacteria group bacterium]